MFHRKFMASFQEASSKLQPEAIQLLPAAFDRSQTIKPPPHPAFVPSLADEPAHQLSRA
jgi:hypothetical protein